MRFWLGTYLGLQSCEVVLNQLLQKWAKWVTFSGTFIFIVHISQFSRTSFRCVIFLHGRSDGSITNLHCEVVALGLKSWVGRNGTIRWTFASWLSSPSQVFALRICECCDLFDHAFFLCPWIYCNKSNIQSNTLNFFEKHLF